MRFAVVIATCGSDDWGDLAWARAYPSARAQGPGVEVVIEHYPEMSVSAARNAAAAHANADWLVFLDADDELEPGYLEAMRLAWMRGAITTDWAPLLVPAIRYVHPPTAFEANPPPDAKAVPGRASIPNRGQWPRVNECVIGTGIRRSCFDEVGGFREWPSIEDYDLFLRAHDAGAQLVYVEDAVYRAHVNPVGRNRDQSCYAEIWAEHLDRAREALG